MKIAFQQTSLVFDTTTPLTLFELNQQIREELEISFPDQYWVVAEVSEVNMHRGSGHCYLQLIDKASDFRGQGKIQAQARATIWSSRFQKIKQEFESVAGQPLKTGIKILFQAQVRFHEMYGMSLDIIRIDPKYTLGDLARQKQETLRRLANEDLLERNARFKLPVVPQRLAVVSSETAAGFQDFVHQLEQNVYGYDFRITLFPATVQGGDAPASVAAALNRIAEFKNKFDVIVVIRGGGSQTDLSCFDQYELVAAIAKSPLPVLTGIGHERDETIADLVAHTRLKTPTAVANFILEQCAVFEGGLEQIHQQILKLASQNTRQASDKLERRSMQLLHATNEQLNKEENRLGRMANQFHKKPQEFLNEQETDLVCLQLNLQTASEQFLKQNQLKLLENQKNTELAGKQFVSRKQNALDHEAQCLVNYVKENISKKSQKFSRISDKVAYAAKSKLQNQEHRLELIDYKVKNADPKLLLQRGYSLTSVNGKILKNTTDVAVGDVISTQFATGKLTSTVTEIY